MMPRLVLLSLLLLAAPAQALVDLPHGAVQEVVADLFSVIDVADVDLQVTCSGGVMTSDPAAGSFHFEESDDPAPTQAVYPGGYGVTGCGLAAYEAPVPQGTDHIHVRFFADRVIEEFALAGFPFRAPIAFNQSVAVFVNGAPEPLAVHAFYEEGQSGRERQAITIPTVYLPDEAATVRVEWRFEDLGTLFVQESQDQPQGVAYSSTVDGVVVEFSSIPLPTLSVKDSRLRNGQALIHQYSVRFEAPADLMEQYAVDLRIRLDPEQQFESLQTPDGTHWTTVGTRIAEGPDGFDRRKVLQENPSNDDVSQITIPTLLSDQYGSGVWEVRTTHTQLLERTTGLIPLAFALLALPFPFGVLAFVRVRTFEREAFGAFRRAGTKLRWSLVVIALYYLAVVLSALPGGRLEAMVTLPLSAAGWILYGQVVIAVLAFMSLWLVANELFSITRPKEPLEP